jgi:uncharacterized protein YggT (Ycf19 family)
MNLSQIYTLITLKIKSNSKIILLKFNSLKYKIIELNQTYPLALKKIKSSFKIILRIAHKTFLKLLKTFRIFLTLRVIMTWFPSLNTRKRPYLFVAKLTKIYLGVFRNAFPKFFRVDISSLLAFIWLRTFIRICS